MTTPQNNTQPLSDCCKAITKLVGGVGDFSDHGEGMTMHYECSMCNRPCDLYFNPKDAMSGEDKSELESLLTDLAFGMGRFGKNFKSTDVANPPTPPIQLYEHKVRKYDMSKAPKVEFVCPTDATHDVKDYEKSTENWLVTKNPCPVCGAQLKVKVS